MPFDPAHFAPTGACWTMIAAFAESDGSARHPMSRRLTDPQVPVRDIADAVLSLCMLHGHQPGVLEHTIARNAMPAAQGWIEVAVEAFAVERALLARLASAAGPLPSTPGQAESESAIISQHHALNMLAQSDRKGCAIGASVALVIDWAAIRLVLDAAARRFGLVPQASRMPPDVETATIVAASSENPATERAMAFGAQQVLAQHRGLWDLLEARASARDQL